MENSKIVVSIATLPEREKMLMRTIASLIEQCDVLQVQLNNYKEIPEWIIQDKIIATLTDNSIRDAFKFYNIEEYKNTYFFTCDDDLIYPKDYVNNMIKWIDKMNKSCIVSHHGRSLKSYPITSYYKESSFRVSCLHDNNYDILLEYPGTGVSAFHTDTITVNLDMFKNSTNADVWFGLQAKKQNVPVLALKHKAGYFGYQHPVDTLFDRKVNDEQDLVDVINEFHKRK